MNSEWQPIETAPKDGTVILVFEPGCGMAIVSWKPKSRPNWHDDHGATMHPTMWMPLPDAPSE